MRLHDLFESADYDLQAKYDHFNQLLFNGELPKVNLGWIKSKRMGGYVDGKLLPTPPGWIKPDSKDKFYGRKMDWSTVVLRLDNLWKRTEAQHDGLLVHEMIHLWMYQRNKLRELHGPDFMGKLRELQPKVDFKIPVSENLDTHEYEEKPDAKAVGVAYGIDKTGKALYFLMTAKTAQDAGETYKQAWEKRLTTSYNDFVKMSLMIVTGEAWSKKALLSKVGRSVFQKEGRIVRLHPMYYFRGDDGELLKELEGATVLWHLVRP